VDSAFFISQGRKIIQTTKLSSTCRLWIMRLAASLGRFPSILFVHEESPSSYFAMLSAGKAGTTYG
jgi:hypothetical protein